MILYILRHAIAEERDEGAYPDDSQRPLSAQGKKKMVRIAKHLKDIGVCVDLILSSPYVRAHETARIVQEAFQLNKKALVFSDQLMPSGSAGNLIAEINEKYPVENLMLVGHEPYLSELIAVLVSGSPAMSVTMKKGGVCCLSLDKLAYAQCATLEWLLTPAQLTRIGK